MFSVSHNKYYTLNDSPHPQRSVSFGLLKVNEVENDVLKTTIVETLKEVYTTPGGMADFKFFKKNQQLFMMLLIIQQRLKNTK